METKELLNKVRQIEIKTKRCTNNFFLGEYQSSFKGRGMVFSEVRPYQVGDDIRNIDWNKTAQYSEPYVKIFEEERELSMMLLVDVSASQSFGTRKQLKKDTVAEVCASLAFSAMLNNDKVGLILFSDEVEFYLPPAKGRFHVLRIIRELVEFEPKNARTNIDKAFKFLVKTQKRKNIVFVLSDFIENNYSKSLRAIARQHDVTGIRVYDEKEEILPDIGMVHFRDMETGVLQIVNTSSKKVRKHHENFYKQVKMNFKNNFDNANAGSISIKTDEDYIKALLQYFKSHHTS